MKKIKSFFSNIWESVTDGQKGSVIDVIKVIFSWIKIFWNAVSSQLNALLNKNQDDKSVKEAE